MSCYLQEYINGSKQITDNLTGPYQLIVYLMYGCGLRMNEALNM